MKHTQPGFVNTFGNIYSTFCFGVRRCGLTEIVPSLTLRDSHINWVPGAARGFGAWREICPNHQHGLSRARKLATLLRAPARFSKPTASRPAAPPLRKAARSEEHTSELQSLTNLVCRLLLEKKKRQ